MLKFNFCSSLKGVTLTTSDSVAEEGVADSAHPVSSVPSVMSVMSEVRGDWGAMGRVKDDMRVSWCVSRVIERRLVFVI